MKMVEVFGVAPCFGSENFPTQTSLPLTFFDILWLRLPPVERVFFYEFPHPTPLFFDSVLPKLKRSLSLTLGRFFPLAGNLTWPLDSNNPFIKYDEGDTVSLTVAESDASFNHLSGSDHSEAKESLNLVPQLSISHEKASVLALQVTLFPNSGFSIAITSHHAVLDGKTSTSFIKSWAHVCRNLGEGESQSLCSLPPELTPVYDRELVNDPKGIIEERYVSEWLKQGGPNNKSLMLWDPQVPEDAKRGLFQLSHSDIEKLKEILVSKNKKRNKFIIHLSTFVISVAYAWVCRVKAEEIKSERVVLGLGVDCRGRLEQPIPPTYFGNCIAVRLAIAETRELLGEEGLIVAMEALNAALESLKEGVLKGAENWASLLFGDDVSVTTNDKIIITVAGSHRFEVYGNDFGWGRPKKVEMTSIDKSGAFSVSDSKNGDGVEIGFVSNKGAIEAFASLFGKFLVS